MKKSLTLCAFVLATSPLYTRAEHTTDTSDYVETAVTEKTNFPGGKSFKQRKFERKFNNSKFNGPSLHEKEVKR